MNQILIKLVAFLVSNFIETSSSRVLVEITENQFPDDMSRADKINVESGSLPKIQPTLPTIINPRHDMQKRNANANENNVKYATKTLINGHNVNGDSQQKTTLLRRRIIKPKGRVQNYSYYYISQKIWYVPLYFLIFYGFYFGYLVIKSIRRSGAKIHHKLAKEHMARRSIEEINYINKLAPLVAANIEQFSKKYK